MWPAIWAHGVWNAVIQGGFDASTAGYSVWVGESGLLTSVMTVAFAIALYKLWPISEQTQRNSGEGRGGGVVFANEAASLRCCAHISGSGFQSISL